jgi:hypothetical protein
MSEIAQTFCGSLSLERQMWPILVVFGLPSFEFSSKIPFMLEMPPLIELLGIGLMTSLDLPVHLPGILEVCVGERCGGRKDAR